MDRSYISDLKEEKQAMIKGWVYEIRDMAKMKFLLIRDITGIVQCVVKEKEILDKISNLSLESVVEVRGKVKPAKIKAEFVRGDVEIEVKSIEILNPAEDLPIHVNEKTVKSTLPKRLDFRSLDVRKPLVQAIFKIQSTIINAYREYFFNEGFIEIQPPGIIATSTEGGTDLFEVKYFDKKAYLAQSPQLYKQLMAISLEKVFSTGAIWRAEKHDTSRHINEIRQMDVEVGFCDDLKVMKYLEEVVKYIVKRVLEKNKHELNLLGIDLKIPSAKYFTYKEAIELLNKHGFDMKFGDDFEPEAERKLCELNPNAIVFTYEWPIEVKPFYIWPKDREKGISGGFDALYGGLEISSGGQRVHVPEVLIQQLKDKGLNPDDFKWYIDAFRYGAPEHAGWSIGLERISQAILGVDNIREVTLFPRDRKRLTP
ncbi:aspartate--tRNA(Asn) ligase [Candidatus Pacearchaeota archaeon ex4484_71]|nr:MAG: aspartate--tRNA(Asn) ligase [Candidatus Pacearchaeota archaeon ex4484_71]